MSGVELGLAILDTLDLCFRYRNVVVVKRKAFHGAVNEIGERELVIEATWQRPRSSLRLVQVIIVPVLWKE
ncbi:hypothetical protein N7501_010366 [Penicillium viridicatum]|nr:hypothetical protein N7501_010366 [Penicillium viridicatum]